MATLALWISQFSRDELNQSCAHVYCGHLSPSGGLDAAGVGEGDDGAGLAHQRARRWMLRAAPSSSEQLRAAPSDSEHFQVVSSSSKLHRAIMSGSEQFRVPPSSSEQVEAALGN